MLLFKEMQNDNLQKGGDLGEQTHLFEDASSVERMVRQQQYLAAVFVCDADFSNKCDVMIVLDCLYLID